MPDIWLPGYRRVDLGLAGGTYLDTGHPKLLWHTTEGSSVAGARSAFAAYPPHVCYDPRTDEAEQYIPLNRSAYACKANDREYVIQVEVVGFAGSSHTWTAAMLERLGRRVVAPITAAVGVAQAVCSHGFRGEGEGIILASPNSPIRLSLNQLRAFSGHLGHQHMPSPDAHWDPGRLPIDEILSYAEEDELPTPNDMWMAPCTGKDAAGQTQTWPAVVWLTVMAFRMADVHKWTAELAGREPSDVDEAAVAADLAPMLIDALAGQLQNISDADIDRLTEAMNRTLPDAVKRKLAEALAGGTPQ